MKGIRKEGEGVGKGIRRRQAIKRSETRGEARSVAFAPAGDDVTVLPVLVEGPPALRAGTGTGLVGSLFAGLGATDAWHDHPDPIRWVGSPFAGLGATDAWPEGTS